MAEKNVTAKAVQETRSVFLPRISGEENTVFVGLNGRSWQIPRGRKVEVPAYVACVLEESERNARAASAYAQACQKDMAVVHGAAPDLTGCPAGTF